MTTVLLKHYLINHNGASLSRLVGESEQLISYLKHNDLDDTYVSYDVATGKVYKFWSEKIKVYYESTTPIYVEGLGIIRA